MLTLATPLWLFGLVLLPAIRWLHRGGRHRRAVPVPHLDLWRGSAAISPAAGQRQPPDPAWRRRALLTALFFIALCEPQLAGRHPRVTLWVDDSMSMLTREAQGTRLALGFAQARSQLAELGAAEVELRSLGDPWHSLGTLTESAMASLSAGAGRLEPGAPPAALLRRERLHWLLTDGADAALVDWPGDRRPDRIIQVGQVTRNAGLERFAARRSLDGPERLELLLKVTNGGTAAETRAVVIATDAGEMVRSNHRLEPGTSTLVTASIPASAWVRARLEPGDALAEDDEIVLDLAPLRRRRVATDSKCPAPLVAALRAHPALAVAPSDAVDVQAALDCGSHQAQGGVATLRVLADRAPERPRGSLQWSSSVAELRRVRLDAERLRLAARLQAQPADAVLLAAGDEAVIVGRAGASKLLETSLDFESTASANGPEVPLLVNLMFEHLLDKRLLDQMAITDRGPASSLVAPSARTATRLLAGKGATAAASTGASAGADAGANAGANAGAEAGAEAGADAGATLPGRPRVLDDAVPPVLLVALLALLWEVVALARQWFRLSRYAEAQSE